VQHPRFELEKDAFEHVSFCGKPLNRFVLSVLTILLVELNKEQRVQAYIVRLILEELWNSGAVCATRRSQAQHTWARSSSDIPKHPRLASEWISSVLVSSLALSPGGRSSGGKSNCVVVSTNGNSELPLEDRDSPGWMWVSESALVCKIMQSAESD
jgi:hypothetical protein